MESHELTVVESNLFIKLYQVKELHKARTIYYCFSEKKKTDFHIFFLLFVYSLNNLLLLISQVSNLRDPDGICWIYLHFNYENHHTSWSLDTEPHLSGINYSKNTIKWVWILLSVRWVDDASTRRLSRLLFGQMERDTGHCGWCCCCWMGKWLPSECPAGNSLKRRRTSWFLLLFLLLWEVRSHSELSEVGGHRRFPQEKGRWREPLTLLLAMRCQQNKAVINWKWKATTTARNEGEKRLRLSLYDVKSNILSCIYPQEPCRSTRNWEDGEKWSRFGLRQNTDTLISRKEEAKTFDENIGRRFWKGNIRIYKHEADIQNIWFKIML